MDAPPNVDAAMGAFALPGFVQRDDKGIFIDLAALDSRQLFASFLDRLYSSGFRLAGGDYPLIHRLLYELDAKALGEWAERLEAVGKPPAVIIARNIVPFADERRLLYRGWRPDSHGNSADYFFEPIHLDRDISVEIPSEVPGNPSRFETRTVSELQALNLDEFYAAAWIAGIRFGWDCQTIALEFSRDGGKFKSANKVTVAHGLEATPGEDASAAEEAGESMHRSNAPKMLRDGRVDLTVFANRFPQVKTGMRLLRKIPRVLGKEGFDVRGNVREPDLPSDFSIDDLAGPGTRVEKGAQGEFVLAAMDGFLNIDSKTNLISVTEKIVNRDGVSVRTTGNLLLQGDEFEEHGEVQERRTVEGLHMTFMADVFGNVVSRGGRITLKRHLAGGSAISEGGSIVIEGGASRATIEAPGGEVTVKFAESSRIVARKVTIERACLCDIVADEVHITSAEGCAVAGRSIEIESTTPRKNSEACIVVVLPDLTNIDLAIRNEEKRRSENAAKIDALSQRQQEIQTAPELKTFLMVQKKRSTGEITMTPEQEAQFRVLAGKAAPGLKQLNDLRTAIQALLALQSEIEQKLAALASRKAALFEGLSCRIELVNGDTVVRTRSPLPNEEPLEKLPARTLAMRLRELGANSRQVFADSHGHVDWRWDGR